MSNIRYFTQSYLYLALFIFMLACLILPRQAQKGKAEKSRKNHNRRHNQTLTSGGREKGTQINANKQMHDKHKD